MMRSKHTENKQRLLDMLEEIYKVLCDKLVRTHEIHCRFYTSGCQQETLLSKKEKVQSRYFLCTFSSAVMR